MVGGPALQADGTPVQDERIFKVRWLALWLSFAFVASA